MEFLDTLITVYDVFKKGANILGEKTESKDSFAVKKIELESNITPARPPLGDIPNAVGVGLPRMDAAFTYFSQQTARDQHLAQILSTDYVARAYNFDQKIQETMNLSSARMGRIGRRGQ